MKAKEIAKRVLKTGYVGILQDASDRQWITDGKNAYLADESLRLTDENLLAALDVAKDKREKIRIGNEGRDETIAYCMQTLAPFIGMDRRMEEHDLRPGVSVCYAGDTVTSLKDEETGETIWARQSYIHPADGKEGLGFARRGPLVALYEDMFCCAVITPEDDAVREKIEGGMRWALGDIETDEDLRRRAEAAEARAEAEHRRAEKAVRRAVEAIEQARQKEENGNEAE